MPFAWMYNRFHGTFWCKCITVLMVHYSDTWLPVIYRSNLSLSPEESWLPLTSIIFCIIHIQLEASIRNGDLQGFQLFSKTSEHLSSMTKKRESKLKEHQGMSEEGRKRKRINLPSAEEQSIDEISKWGVPKMPSQDAEPLNEDGDVDKGRKH